MCGVGIMRSGIESGTTNCDECGEEFEYATTITYRDGGVESVLYTTYQKEKPSE